MIWGNKRVREPDRRTGWFAEGRGHHDERYYRDGAPTDEVRIVTRDEDPDGGGTRIIVEGYSCRLIRYAGRLVVRERGGVGVHLSIPLSSCVSAEISEVATVEGPGVLSFALDARLGAGVYDSMRFVTYFPGDCAELLYRATGGMNADDGTVSAPAGSGEPAARAEEPAPEEDAVAGKIGDGSHYYLIDPAVGFTNGLRGIFSADAGEGEGEAPPRDDTEVVERGATLPRIRVRRAPDTREWVSFRPLASSDDVLLEDSAGYREAEAGTPGGPGTDHVK